VKANAFLGKFRFMKNMSPRWRSRVWSQCEEILRRKVQLQICTILSERVSHNEELLLLKRSVPEVSFIRIKQLVIQTLVQSSDNGRPAFHIRNHI